MFETYVFTNDLDVSDLPKEGNYYVVADNGIFLHKDTGLFEGFVKVEKVRGLGKLNPRVKPKLPKIPAEIVYKAYCFFHEVYKKYQSESALMLYYNKEKRQYYLYCPKQEVSHGGVEYDQDFDLNNEEDREIINWFSENGFHRVGSIHSHCDFNAFHSGIDTDDESEKNGIHMTIGHVDCDFPEIVTSFAVNNNRFKVDPESVVVGLKKKQVQVNSRGHMGFFRGLNSPVTEDRYDFDFTEERFEELEELFYPEIEGEWLPLVETHSFRKKWNAVEEDDDDDDFHQFNVNSAVRHQSNLTKLEEEKNVKNLPDLEIYDVATLRRVKSHAKALKHRSATIPIQRIRELTNTLEEFFEVKKVDSEHINIACSIIPEDHVYEE